MLDVSRSTDTPRSLSNESKHGMLRFLKKQSMEKDSFLRQDDNNEASFKSTSTFTVKESPKPTPRSRLHLDERDKVGTPSSSSPHLLKLHHSSQVDVPKQSCAAQEDSLREDVWLGNKPYHSKFLKSRSRDHQVDDREKSDSEKKELMDKSDETINKEDVTRTSPPKSPPRSSVSVDEHDKLNTQDGSTEMGHDDPPKVNVSAEVPALLNRSVPSMTLSQQSVQTGLNGDLGNYSHLLSTSGEPINREDTPLSSGSGISVDTVRPASVQTGSIISTQAPSPAPRHHASLATFTEDECSQSRAEQTVIIKPRPSPRVRRASSSVEHQTLDTTQMNESITLQKEGAGISDPQLNDSINRTRPKTSTSSGAPVRRARSRIASLPASPRGRRVASPAFTDTLSIRQAVWEDWYWRKTDEKTRKRREAVAEEEEKRAKEEEAKREQKEMAALSFTSWKEKREEFFKKKWHEKVNTEKAKEKELIDKAEQKTIALKTFEIWRENKDILLKEQKKKANRVERVKTIQIEENKNEKWREAQKLYDFWKSRKDVDIRKKLKETMRKTCTTKELERSQKFERIKEAEQSYEDWLQRKERQMERDTVLRQRHRSEELDSPRPAWSPVGRGNAVE
ncbi:PREDICTED: microtubule-associated protein 9-like isoform X2 [Priapulus caudatus]|uniref:Microtubule-associated protein 9-like isoform X2 n=1 Tax=Priapulus caudatus TaxID=37621 RepID=A0ABM1EK94_PRICU|nr:PREDICTED: microtubule-associated protein 9-like isoform X2 [Priapulus caudatus]